MTALPAQLELDPQNLEASFIAIWNSGQKKEALDKIALFIEGNRHNLDVVCPAFKMLEGLKKSEEACFSGDDLHLVNIRIRRFADRKYPDSIWQLAVDTLTNIETNDSVLSASRAIIDLYKSDVEKEPRVEFNALDQRALRVISVLKNMVEKSFQNHIVEHFEMIGNLSPCIEVTKSAIATSVEIGKYIDLRSLAKNNPAMIPFIIECVSKQDLPNDQSCLYIASLAITFGNEEDTRRVIDWLVKVADSEDPFRDSAIKIQNILGDSRFDLLTRIQNPLANKVLHGMSDVGIPNDTYLVQALDATIALQTKFALAASEGQNDTVELVSYLRSALAKIIDKMDSISRIPQGIHKLHLIFDKALEQKMIEPSDRGLVEWFNSLAIRQAALDTERAETVRLVEELQVRLFTDVAPSGMK